MSAETSQLEPCLSGRTCIVGLGNPGYGDDGFGVYLAQALKSQGVADVISAGAAPERFLGRIRQGRFEHVIFVDAVECAAEPGSMVFLSAREVVARFPQVSTHKISVGTLAKVLEGDGGTQVWLLGVQPESLQEGAALSAKLRTTAEALVKLVLSGKRIPAGAAAEEAKC